jgi:predicted nucleotidyltransferase
MTMTPGVIGDKRGEVLQIVDRHGAGRVRVFGSVVRGDAGPDSDVDILIDLEQGRSLLDIVAIKQDLEDLLGCRVDVVTEAAISPYIRDRVLEEAVSL